ncbi:MPN domain-containing protein CG4751 [Anopheles cruzii]|uniref:MPN domain-containing protein CG4751 n=1 Tax=Anopheles cruzii TaxID=68878 RepID=UPI0022EC6D73|nr:MPN domain-containing protein CG4751 [Anopheles cruzii]
MSTKASEEETSSHLDESDIGDEFNDDDVEKLGYFPGKTVTLQMLLGAHVLQPGKGAMTIEYLGQKFVGDLLADGKIKSQETETIFCSPSAWAIYCKRIINPDKKSGCGWASVKYKGRKLDAYKAAYYRKQQKERDQHQKDDLPPGEELAEETEEDKTAMEPPPVRRNIVAHNTISNRNVMHDSNTLIEAVPFTSLGKMQPFLVTVSTSTLLVMDFHCHLTNHEVCGYLGGTWDINAHNLSITHAFPCRNTRHDRDKAALCELQIQKLMIKKNINLVGWYHSHPRFPVQPTLRDCDAQLDYQIRMRGPTEASYIPCIGFICSPYDEQNTALESNVMSFWVTPPPENRPSEYGRPMLMTYTLVQDETLSEDVKEEMMLTVDYYKQFKRELINFQSIYGARDVPYIEKLRRSLSPRFPRDSTSGHFWNWVRELLGLDPEEIPEVAVVVTSAPEPPIAPPPTAPAKLGEEPSSGPPIVNLVNSAEEMETKNEDDFDSEMGDSDVISLKDEDGKGPAAVGGPAIAVPSLQAQLKRPSGLNMTPSPLSSALVVLPTNLSQTAPPGQPQGAPGGASATAPSAATNLSMNNNQAPSSVPPPPSSVASNNHQTPAGHHGTHGTITVAGSSLMNATNTSSPRDSPITIPSNSASPAKFEVPVRASPSPAKSDTSSCRSRTRNSPAPSPGKLSIGDILGSSSSVGGGAGNRNSPTLSSLIGGSGGGGGGAGASSSNIHDLYAATFASLGTALPANLLSQEYAALFGQGQGGGSGSGGGNSKQRDEYGLSALTALAQVAAASGLSNSQINETLLHSLNRSMSSKASSGGGQGGSSSSPSTITSNSGAGSGGAGGLPAIPNMKEFMQQLEKGNLSLLMQSQYGANPLLGMGSGPGMGGVGGGGTPPPPTGGGKSGSGRSSKSRSKANQAAAAAAAAVAAQQQLHQAQQALLQHQSMMDYADFTSKFDQSKLVDLMKTPEYSQMLLQQAQALGSLGSEISIVKKPSGKGAGSGGSASGGANNNRDSTGHGPIGTQGNNSTSSSSYGGGQHSSSAIGTPSSIGGGSKKESAQDLITKLRTMFSTDSYLPPVPTAADINLLVEQSQKYPVIQQILNSGNLDDIQVLLKAQSLSNNALDFASFLGGGPGGTNGNSMAAGHGDGGSGKGGKGSALKDDASSNNMTTAAAAAAAMNPYLGVTNLSALFEPIQRMGGSPSGGGGGGKGSKADKASIAAAAAAAAAVSSASITNPTDMLNSLFTSAAHGGAGGSADMNALLYSQAAAAAAAAGGKGTAADLNLLFGGGSLTSNSGSSGASSGGGGPGMSAGTGSGGNAGGKAAAAAAAQASLDYLSMFPNFSAAAAAAKLPDMSSLFSQEKYEIPDPLSKATLEANNMYLAPSASLLKLHQEAFNSMLMKPPKSSSSSTSSSGKIDTPPPSASIIPSPGSRSTPTKSANRESPSLGSAGGGGGGGGSGNSKYNFSAVDLAVSSVVPLAASSPLGGASGAADLSRKAPQTPPVDMSRSSPAIPATATSPGAGSSSSSSGILPPYKKRMEFASIADLVAAPPAKIPKMSTENLDP